MQVGSQRWTVSSLATGAAAVVSILLAVATTHILYMVEKCAYHVEVPNGTQVMNVTIHSKFGILQLCSMTYVDTQTNEAQWSCVDSGVTKGLEKNDERDETQWKTGTVTEATRIQFPSTCLAVVLTICGFVTSIIGNYKRDKRVIVSAVLYISSGLCLSISVVLFISRINDELSLQESRDCSYFSYSYGWSFYLIGLAFVMEETSAVISVKLFLMTRTNKLNDMIKVIPGLEEKLNGVVLEVNGVSKDMLEDDDPSNHTLIW